MSTNQHYISSRSAEMVDRASALYVSKPPFPVNIMIELSNTCNHACIFCANPKMTRQRRSMDRDLVMSILSQARDCGAREVGFYSTGDPFMHPRLSEFVKEAKRLGYEYTYISTNGALATPERSKAVIDSGIDSIKFSINAGSRETFRVIHGKDDWDKVISHLRFVSEYRKTLDRELKLSITYVVIAQNHHQCADFSNQFGSIVDEIFFNDGNTQQGNMLENYEILAPDSNPTPNSAPCYMPFSRAHVTCEGFLTLCCVDYQNYLAVADLKAMSLLEAWQDPLFVEMRERHLQNKLEGTLCFNCIYGKPTPIEPLVPRLATITNFNEAAEANLKKQRDRLGVPE